MKPFALAGILLIGGTATALAGNIGAPIVEPPLVVPAQPAPLPAYDWAGGYLGLGLSYGRATHAYAPATPAWPNGTGPGIGALAGYNWQNGNLVYGVEGHVEANRIRGSETVAGAGDTRTDVSALGSLRLRLGVAQDRTLFFATAGGAAGRVGYGIAGSDLSTATATGGMIGLGIEHAVRDGFHIRGDLEHYRFGGRDITIGAATYPDIRARANVARISAVFRF